MANSADASEQPSGMHRKFLGAIGKDLILFPEGTADLQDRGRVDGSVTLVRMRRWIRENPGLKFRLEARTTERTQRNFGNEKAEQLAQSRLNKVYDSLLPAVVESQGEMDMVNLWKTSLTDSRHPDDAFVNSSIRLIVLNPDGSGANIGLVEKKVALSREQIDAKVKAWAAAQTAANKPLDPQTIEAAYKAAGEGPAAWTEFLRSQGFAEDPADDTALTRESGDQAPLFLPF